MSNYHFTYKQRFCHLNFVDFKIFCCFFFSKVNSKYQISFSTHCHDHCLAKWWTATRVRNVVLETNPQETILQNKQFMSLFLFTTFNWRSLIHHINIYELIWLCPCAHYMRMISETAYSSQTKLIGESLHLSDHGIGLCSQ